MSDETFADRHPLAWSFHRNTSRWAANVSDGEGRYFQTPPREYPLAPFRKLPPALPLDAPLRETLRDRTSCRRFRGAESLTLPALGTLLHTAYGIRDRSAFGSLEFLDRPVPSAGGLYSLELYALVRRIEDLPAGVYHYAPVGHGVEQLREVLVPSAFSNYLFMGQRYVTQASLVVVIASEVDRCLRKYGDRGYRYVLIEAGHCAQNLHLAAVALGLASCAVGGFFDQELAELLTLDTDVELPLYGVAIGVPEALAPPDRRGLDLEES